MTGSAVPVYTAKAADAERVIAVLGLAFCADPATRWAFRDPHQYWTVWSDFVRAFAGQAFAQGTAFYIGEYEAAALWLPQNIHPDEEALGALMERSVAPSDQPDVFAVLEQMGGYHPSEPHWYLPLIGVDPIVQGKGYGSALLAHALAQCDREHLPAYLESSNPRNNPLYERHGFEAIGTIQAGRSPTFWPMLRRAR
jgi:GNAT superfamily N-acetyltransferase